MPADLGRGLRRHDAFPEGPVPGPGLTAFGHGGDPGQAPAIAAEQDTRDDQYRSFGRRVEGERAERDGAGAAHPYSVLDVRGVEQGSVPLFPGGEPVLAGRKRDPGRLAPADQARAAVDPGHRVRLR